MMTDIIERLHNSTEFFHNDCELKLEAISEIERLRDKCNKQAMILRRLNPDMNPGVYFICGEMGEKDQNGLPEQLLVVPAYGCDWHMVYKRTDKISGPEW